MLLTPVFFLASAFVITGGSWPSRCSLPASLSSSSPRCQRWCSWVELMPRRFASSPSVARLAHQLSREPPSELVQQALHRHPGRSGRGVRRCLPDLMAIRARHSGTAGRGAQHAARAVRTFDPRPLGRSSKLLLLLARVGTALKHFVISSALFVAGFAAIWLPVFLIELHGDVRSYYRHFFGFFLGASGWGTFPGAVFRIVPSELLDRRLASILLFAALILWGLYRLRKAPGALIAWLVMLSANWFAVAYGYFKNQSGGGLHYFFEFFALAWILHLACFLPEAPVGGPGSTRARLCGRPDAAGVEIFSRSESCSLRRASKAGCFANAWPT